MIAVRTLFPIYRKSSRVTTRFAMILRFENAKQAVAIFHAIACHLSARTNSKLPIKQSALRRYPVQFAGRWEESIASNKERNRVVVRLDFDVKSAAASGYRA